MPQHVAKRSRATSSSPACLRNCRSLSPNWSYRPRVDKRSIAAKRKARHKLRTTGKSPKSPTKLVNTLIDLYDKASPKTKTALSTIMPSPNTARKRKRIVDTFKEELKGASKRRRLFGAKVAHQAEARSELGFQKSKLFEKVVALGGENEEDILKRKTRSDTLPAQTKSDVRDFLVANSTVVANVKCMKKGVEERRILNDSLRNLLKKYNKTAKQQVRLTAFCEQRGDILLQDQGKFLQCLCEVCENFKLLLEALQKYLRKLKKKVHIDFELKIPNVLEHMLCSVDDIECILGKCNQGTCGTINFNDLLSNKDDKLTYTMWGKDSANRKVLLEHEETIENLCKLISEQAPMLAIHLHDAKWQWTQYVMAKASLTEGELLMVLDFAENFRTIYQNEVSSAHWSYTQVTIHPFACHYICPRDGALVTDNFIIISDNLKHDANAVKIYTSLVLRSIKEERGITVTSIVQFTDGCAAQYKSRLPFLHISEMEIPTVRSYFGSRHGKGPCDGLAALVKTAATRAIKSKRATISSAKTMYDFANDHLTCFDHDHKKGHRKFLFVGADEMTQSEESPDDLETVQGTQHLHCVSSTGERGKIKVRLLSCSCLPCKDGDYEDCADPGVVGPWEPVSLTEKKPLQLPNLAQRKKVFLAARNAKKSTKAKKSTVTKADDDDVPCRKSNMVLLSCTASLMYSFPFTKPYNIFIKACRNMT